jgi:hypothetical protein
MITKDASLTRPELMIVPIDCVGGVVEVRPFAVAGGDCGLSDAAIEV